jgi:hypothetical protein
VQESNRRVIGEVENWGGIIMVHIKSMVKILGRLLAIMLLSVNYSCGAVFAQQITLPQDTNLVLAITRAGRIFVLDNEGKEVPICQLCTDENKRQYGPKCENAPKELICKVATGGILGMGNSAVILESHSSPGCHTSIIAGEAREKCW